MTDASRRDALFSTPLDQVADFSFDERVVDCFPDMIRRSVPGYAQITSMAGVIAARHLSPDAHILDLGCSLGASTLSICQRLVPDAFTLQAIDLSQPMVEKARGLLTQQAPEHHIEVLQGDIRDCPLPAAGMIMVNFTLQFLDPSERDHVIKRLYDALTPGGVLLLSEKILGEPGQEQLLIDLHHDFKRANGYSDLEISQKRTALEEVMIPDRLSTHHERLRRTGFTQHDTWFQYLNFASILAFK
ncbi:carboxy-S-adenosyl-L-methionine synthase CmoA [Kushneria indalinina]|uniref:Carboxy-S-adenosyl-L-methionine synthase n=1 Tax=Kushneria indalinina DSM 14324 TaxID=1122140 RepID=A0A3D9DVK8_9GAMM|nr:carboxy-S-adenosyl-L-methionine synthase CmoA [Kushneria indalinina]REC94394.1 tRNA (cmo5U34)-methyltransferase [Kushneria indalinina DSM 14324]